MATNNDEVTLELSDSVYNIRIVIPNTETMEIQVSKFIYYLFFNCFLDWWI